MGMIAGVWDGGKVRSTHQEFNNDRILLGDGYATLSSHATHVSGIIMSVGIDLSLKGLPIKGLPKLLLGFRHLRNGCFCCRWILVSNHSYGYTKWAGKWRFGAYDRTSADYDMLSELFPLSNSCVGRKPRNLVHPQITAKIGYDLLTGSTLSKKLFSSWCC
jgi:hypothetical protein